MNLSVTPASSPSVMKRSLEALPVDLKCKKVAGQDLKYRPPLRDVKQEPIPSSQLKNEPSPGASGGSYASYSRCTQTLDIAADLKKTLRLHAIYSVRDLQYNGQLISAEDLQKGTTFVSF